MQTITLVPMTEALFYTYYRDFQHDPDLFMDMAAFREFRYSKEWVDAYIRRQREKKRKIFAVMLEGKPVGEVVLKDIDEAKKACTLGICLQNDSVKGKGIGTQAERLILDYATGEMGMETVLADVILKNTRSQHVLEKVGFVQTGQDETFRYYKYGK